MNEIVTHKKCTQCSKEKIISDFDKRDDRPSGSKSYCKDCRKSNHKSFYGKNQNRFRDAHYKQKYGITLEDYERMYMFQEGKCAICKKHESRLCVDHNHKSKKVRGLLCPLCNKGVGLFYENKKILVSAIEYLESYSE